MPDGILEIEVQDIRLIWRRTMSPMNQCPEEDHDLSNFQHIKTEYRPSEFVVRAKKLTAFKLPQLDDYCTLMFQLKVQLSLSTDPHLRSLTAICRRNLSKPSFFDRINEKSPRNTEIKKIRPCPVATTYDFETCRRASAFHSLDGGERLTLFHLRGAVPCTI